MAITTPGEYRQAFLEERRGQTVTGVCGRIVRGRRPSDFTRLSSTKGRRLAWVYGHDGLETLLGRAHSEIILGMGKTRTWLRDKVAAGNRWKLFVFPEVECTLGDWPGIWSAIATHYPEVNDRLSRWRDDLETKSLEECTGPSSFNPDDAKQPDHPEHVSADRFVAEDTLRNARLFLWHALGINELFTGTGYATSEDGVQGGKEFLAPNVPVTDIEGLVAIDLEV